MVVGRTLGFSEALQGCLQAQIKVGPSICRIQKLVATKKAQKAQN
jgi:hypothetical protein